MRKAFAAVAIAAMSTVASSAWAETLTGPELREALVGNTRQWDIQSVESGRWGTMYTFYDADGKYYAKNNWGESGYGVYTIDDDGTLCVKWEKKGPNWTKAVDSCAKYELISPDKLRSSTGLTVNLVKGDSGRAKP